MALLLFLALFLSFTNYSYGGYCVCKGGAADPTTYQRVIDYACGAGADCRAIQPNGPCYVNNNPKAICDYAVNSYFQNKGQVPGSCVFSNVAAPSDTPPSPLPTGCSFPNSGSAVSTGTGMPSTTPGGITTGTGSSGTSIFSPNGMGPSAVGPDYSNPNGSQSTFCKGTLLLISALFSCLFVLCA